MSYKNIVLADYPLSYHPLDDLTTGDVPDFNDLLAQFDTYQDVLDFYPSYANMSGSIAYDYSGCNNIGTYSGAPETNILPIVPGNSMATKITDSIFITYSIEYDYAGKQYGDHFATKYSSDADFTLECWIYPKIISGTETTIFGDSTNNIGLFYDQGNIVFKLDTQTLTHTLSNIDEVIHVVAVYAVTAAYIYINGEIVGSLSLSDFAFTNDQCNLKSGPTDISDYFLINSAATYRYALSANQINTHYEEAKGLDPIQIVAPNNGEVFSIHDNSPSLVYKYSYPGNKSWDYFTTNELYYDQSKNTLAIKYDSAADAKTIVLDDYITLPVSTEMDSSKIEWNASSGVSISTSLDGTTYTQCTNGDSIPGYDLNSFDSSRQLYIRVTMDTTDSSKYLPRIEDLIIAFYNNQILYAENSSSYISTLENDVSISDYNISFCNDYSEILWRKNKNGISTVQDSGFHITTTNSINSIQFFYTPNSLNDSGLISTTATNGYSASTYLWHNSGAISKTNISAIYVNGVNKTSETNVSNVFKENDLHHVLIVFGSSVSGEIKFNHSLYGSIPALFQNIALYPDSFSSDEAANLYNLYIYKDYDIYNASQSLSINMTENSVNYYNNDWLVIQTS